MFGFYNMLFFISHSQKLIRLYEEIYKSLCPWQWKWEALLLPGRDPCSAPGRNERAKGHCPRDGSAVSEHFKLTRVMLT